MIYLCYDTALNEEYTLIKLMQHYPDYISLFKGTDDEAIWDAAPYLFAVNDHFYELREDWLIQLDHCILFQTADTGEEVCRFLQYYMYERTGGKTAYVRIWDARILTKLLPEWDEKERIKFFSFFEAVYTEQENKNWLDKWQLERFNKPVAEAILTTALLPRRSASATESPFKHPVNLSTQPLIREAPDKAPYVQSDANNLPKRRRFFIE